MRLFHFLCVQTYSLLANRLLFLSISACIYQETSERQGKPISLAEKNADATNRRQVYQSNLRSTLLRLRGSFADVLLGAAKDIQETNAKREARIQEEVQNDIQKDLQKEIQQRMNTEMNKVKEKAEAEIGRARGAGDAEINRLNRELSALRHEKEAEISRLNRELTKTKHDSEVEIGRLHQDMEAMQQSKGDTMAKLSSTLETLQTTCVNAQTMEKKLNESEDMLQRAYSTQRELRERAGLESERVSLCWKCVLSLSLSWCLPLSTSLTLLLIHR